MVFYFTATGNCLYVARELAAQEDSMPVSISQEMAQEGELRYEADAIGIVYPIYGHMMPTMVREFVERATFDTPYFYLVPTYGCRHANAVELGAEVLRDNGIEPAYISTLLMVDNWLPNFDMDEQRSLIPEKHIDENLARIKADVAARKHWIEPVSDEDRAAHEQFLSFGLTFDGEHLENFLKIDNELCIGCGICSRVCPAGCISLSEGVACREARAGSGCNACLACIHACPKGAISLPAGESNPHARFLNEHVTLSDIMAANTGR